MRLPRKRRCPMTSSPFTPTLVVLITTAALSACASSPTSTGSGPRYEAPRTVDTLEIPPGLTGPTQSPAFQVPVASGERVSAVRLDQAIERSSPAQRSTAATLMPRLETIEIARDGRSRWLIVEESPEILWPRLQQFWSTQNLVLERDEPRLGVMQTEWSENRAGIPLSGIQSMLARTIGSLYDAGTRDQYRLRLEPLNGKTEIFLTHRGAVEGRDQVAGGAEGFRWFITGPDAELEAEMVNRLVFFLSGGDLSTQDGSLAELDFERSGQVDLVERDGRILLTMQGNADILWRRLGFALERAGLLVDDSNRASGQLDVTYQPDLAVTAERPGFFRRLLGRASSQQRLQGNTYRIQMIHLSGQPLEITILARDGTELRASEARLLLEQIQPHLR
jgi:outer membrane protein assembly factor BamC